MSIPSQRTAEPKAPFSETCPRHWLVFSLALLVWPLLCGCSDQAAERQANPPLLIELHQSVGKVHAGMTVQQVVAELGEPQRRTANALEYTRLGFAVLPDRDGIIQVVMCGDVTGINGPLVKAFSGRTKEGIGMNSTHEQVLTAFGPPAEDKSVPGGLEIMHYPSLGLTLTLEGRKVHHLIVRFQSSEEPDRSILIERAPAQGPAQVPR